MHSLIQKLLGKRGIKSTEELDSEEKVTFDTWQKILSKEELTVSDIKDFCAGQIGIIEGKWADYGLDSAKKAQFIPYHTVYKAILAAIDSPKATREALERQLIELTK